MDPRDRADAVLSKARARGKFVVTPENATSPMDSANTQQIARAVVAEIDQKQDPDRTMVLPASLIAAHDHHLAEASPTRPLTKSVPDDAKTGSPQPSSPEISPVQQQPDQGLVVTAGAPQPRSASSPNTNRENSDTDTKRAETSSPDSASEQELEGLIPTITQKSSTFSSLSRTLEGLD